jgi:hypothetical protein
VRGLPWEEDQFIESGSCDFVIVKMITNIFGCLFWLIPRQYLCLSTVDGRENGSIDNEIMAARANQKLSPEGLFSLQRCEDVCVWVIGQVHADVQSALVAGGKCG